LDSSTSTIIPQYNSIFPAPGYNGIMQAEEPMFSKEPSDMASDNKQIYIVDDDVSVRRALKLLMVTYGFEVEAFSSPEDFFSAVPNSMPGCLIMDIHMSGLNGWDAHQKLVKSGSKRPVILISADKNEGLKEKALKAGAAGFLQKPFHDQDLVDLINATY
jgi:FixJ family two-component response regulator